MVRKKKSFSDKWNVMDTFRDAEPYGKINRVVVKTRIVAAMETHEFAKGQLGRENGAI